MTTSQATSGHTQPAESVAGHLPAALVKPRLRGWLHQWAFAVSLVAGAALVATAAPGLPRLAAAVYAGSVSLLFGTSALYHRRTWSRRARAVMKRLDHSMILVLIAGTYTPLALLVLPPSTGRWLMWVVWTGAAVGVAARMLWLDAPSWAAIGPYLLVGWVALLALPQLLEYAGPTSFTLILAGGVTYTAGAVIYARHRPDPLPEVFGYHEVFHLLTIVAGVAFYVVNALAVQQA